MSTDKSSPSIVLAKIGLRDVMIQRDAKPCIFDEKIFEIYAPKEYLISSTRETDEVYRMSERVLIHRLSGMRMLYLTTEDYSGDEIRYKLSYIFIISLQNKRLEIVDVEFSEQYFDTHEGRIPFSLVKRDSKGD